MQISLDFYRILGVPTRATPEQLQQAFEDRLQQLPRQEYSSAAIATRKQLLEEAFVVLADPEKRKAYDQSWTEDPETESPPEAKPPQTLEIVDSKLAGVLLLLQEVGDYQQILDLGANYLQRPIDLNRVPTQAGTSEEDVILAMALANLELGRDQWQQSQFEAAAGSLQAGLDLLTQEQHFPDVQADIRSDLYKLRPYRILELLNGSEPEAEERSKGLALLQSMLDDRDGIDGNQDDQSGLSVNDFLRFIQQLREYLTVAEQQELFEREATRPSAVASYLAVYALIARGVSSGKPELVERAKTLLTQLGDRQDIAIEQGMCWLLLGQPEAAHKSVLLTQDQESLEFLRQYSEGAPDLIPGLYLYTENWLQHEVYPYFRDLAGKPVSLQSYFDDPAIQKALSELEFKTAASTTTHIKKVPAIATDDPSWQADPANTSTPASAPVNPSTTAAPASQPFVADDPLDGIFDSAAVLEPTVQRSTAKASDPRSVAPLAGSAEAAGSSRPQRARAKASTAGTPPTQELRKKVKQRSGRQPNSKPAKSMGWIPWAIGLLIMTGFVVGAMALSRWMKPTETASPDLPLGTASPSFSPSPTPSLPSPTAASQSPTATPTTTATPSASGSPSGTASSTPSALPTRSPAASSTSSVLSKADAAQVIENWQSIKATSRGQQYDTSKLSQVLADPVLSDWKRQVSDDKSNRVYLEYNLDSVDIQAVKPNGANQASVQALVKETRKTYDNGKVDTANSKADSYRVEYRLARQNDQWLIKDWVVLP